MIWNEHNIRRIILDMAAQLQKVPVSALAVQATYPIDLNRDLGMDSLSQMLLAAQVNEFFGVFQTSVENYLLTDSILDHWVMKIIHVRLEKDSTVVFRTSGTSGNPKRVSHLMDFLLREACVLQELLPRPTQVFSTVPSNHMYGFLYTVVLPSLWAVPVRSLAELNTTTLTTDSLIIGTPFTWEYVYRTLGGLGSIACHGVSSTAPLSSRLFSELTEAGIELVDVYGSSDTGGLAFRKSPDAPFLLFPHVSMMGDQEVGSMPDRIERISEREIRVVGRFDGAIQIGGVNIYPKHIQQLMVSCPLVAECDLYAKSVDGQPQLFCAIQLRTRTDQTKQACLTWFKENLSAPEIPRNIQFY
ncbi:AMP-binding protein [Spirosoma spitsbergense]|jgi:long-chain acyl-CoA synthetase|uniref:AMP-binding protein n=1 Tax=Spirosoma spitsbergense TaxID=431554 RepID=UPI000377C409|nr:AMP-binding protein [Spirosoma spitsbergense]